MKKFILTVAIIAFFSVFNVFSQCDSIALIGEFSGWASDTVLIADEGNPDLCSIEISFSENDDLDENGTIEMKFRTVGDWANNWGDNTFPTGVGIQDGMNIPVPFGDYVVSFNCLTHEYNFADYVGVGKNKKLDIILFPNPAFNTLLLSSVSSILKIEIYSLVGQKVHTQFNDGEQEIEMNISKLKPGIYFIKTITLDGLTLTKKFIKN